DAGANRSRGRSLRLEEDREHVREVAVRVFRIVAPGHPEGPRDVRAVAAQRPADVEHDRLARPGYALRRLVVPRRRGRARGDDREHRRFVTFVDQPLADLPRDVSLGAPDERPAGDGRDAPIRSVGGRAATRSAAWAAPRSRAISSSSLLMRSSRSTVDAGTYVARSPSAAWIRS